MTVKPKKIKWEKSVARLEEIVRELEGSAADLDESLKLFEEGNLLVRTLEEALAKAELRVRKVIDEGDRVKEEPFAEEKE